MDHAVRQRLLQFGNSFIGDLSPVEIELLQIGQPSKMYQPRIGNFCLGKRNRF